MEKSFDALGLGFARQVIHVRCDVCSGLLDTDGPRASSLQRLISTREGNR